MRLRTRLLLGYGYLVLLVLLVAGVSTVGFFELSKTIHTVLDENFASVRASIDMLHSLERQHSDTMKRLSDDPGSSPAPDGRNFEVALDKASQNISLPEEKKVVADIRHSYEQLVTRRKTFFGRPNPSLTAYDADVYPAFIETKSKVVRLLELNYNAMLAADADARDVASRFGFWIGIVVVIALVSVLLLARSLQDHLIRRLSAMSNTVTAVASGDMKRRFTEAHDDELGRIAALLNETLDREEEFRNRANCVDAEGRRITAAVFRDLVEPPAVIQDCNGEVLAAVGDDELVEWILHADPDDPRLIKTRLEFGGRRVGELVRLPATQSAVPEERSTPELEVPPEEV